MQQSVPNLYERFAVDLQDIGVVKCGSFKLKTGMMVPVYFDFRVLISHPGVLSALAEEVAKRVDIAFGRDSFDVICGVPYTALPISVLAAQHLDAPLVMKRKEAKQYGTMTLIDGRYKPGDRAIIIEDTVTSGLSIVEVAQALEAAGIRVVGVVALLDREQGGALNLSTAGLSCTFLFKASDLLYELEKIGRFDRTTVDSVVSFLRDNQVPLVEPERESEKEQMEKENNNNGATRTKKSEKALNAKLSELSLMTTPISIGHRLFEIIKAKKTNLCLAADVETCKQLIDVADLLGPYICALKTHVDLLEDDFDSKTADCLVDLAKKHSFVIIEDRKLADIGNTSKRIFTRTCQWADLVTVHALPGAEQIRAMSTTTCNKPCGVLLVAQMSCDGNLIDADYTKACVDMVRQFPGFVAGVVAQNMKCLEGLQGVHSQNSFAVFTPGVSLSTKSDNVGQRYSTPDDAIRERGADVVIVGRGILDSFQGLATTALATIAVAEKYRSACWKAFEEIHT